MNQAYHTLEQRFARMSDISGAQAALLWDQATMMPPGGAGARSRQLATLSVLHHEIMTAPDMPRLIEQASAGVAELDAWQTANLREIEQLWVHAGAMPVELVENLSKASSAAEMTWRRARAENDFASLAPELQTLIDLVRESAKVRGQALGVEPYDALIDRFDPGTRMADIDRLFAELDGFLRNRLSEIITARAADDQPRLPAGPFPVATQEKLARKVITRLGFDFNHGRLDVSHHPFSGGVPQDSRITTRYDEADFTSSLMAVIHEAGHSQYERNLPAEWIDQPVGRARGMTVHESQSLLYEMQAARSDQFISWLVSQLREAFACNGPEWQVANIKSLYRHAERGFIRVDADEVTYPLHIMLRYSLERRLIDGSLKAKELPEAWSQGMKHYLDITPPDDAVGCMQDIHWPSGAFGYFPSYTLGALAAAQIFAAATQSNSEILDGLANGDFTALNAWLKASIHSQASLRTTPELIEHATGAPLATTAFQKHLESRYLLKQ